MSNQSVADRALAELVVLDRVIRYLNIAIEALIEADLSASANDVTFVQDTLLERARVRIGCCRTTDLTASTDLAEQVDDLVHEELDRRADVPPHDEHVGVESAHVEGVAL
jgi:hypothetical protein